MKNKKILSLLLASVIGFSNIPSFALVTKEQSYFSQIKNFCIKKYKNLIDKKYGKKIYHNIYTNIKNQTANLKKKLDTPFNKKIAYGSLAITSAIIIPYLFAKTKRIISNTLKWGLGIAALTGIIYAAKTAFGKKIIGKTKNLLDTAKIKIKNQAKKDYIDVSRFIKNKYKLGKEKCQKSYNWLTKKISTMWPTKEKIQKKKDKIA